MGIAIGIDLGTTNTVVAGIVDGMPRIVLTSENLRYIPSVVCYDERADAIYVGAQARDFQELQPNDTVYAVKRLMGMLHYDDEHIATGRATREDVERFRQVRDRVGYRIVADPKQQDDGVRVLLGKDRYYTPEEISALILTRAKEEAERFFKDEVTGAVITVPAYFEEKQRRATRRAGQLSGLEVLDILEEPFAAAIAAGFRNPRESHYVLVYDLGGGTFDVSLVHVHHDNYRVREQGGDNWLGGEDMDYELVKLVAERVRADHQYDPLADPGEARAFVGRLKPVVEEAKIALSERDDYRLNAPNCCQVPLDAERSRWRQVSVRELVTRADFEARIASMVDHTLKEVQEVLRKSEIQPDLVDAVLLVGGATYVPSVRHALETQFPNLVRSVEAVHPMDAVAEGAALRAHDLRRAGARVGDAGRIVSSVTERSIGIAAQRGGKTDVFEVIVPRGTRVPMAEPIERHCVVSRGDRIEVPVYAGEQPHVSDNRHQGNIDLDLGDDPLTPGTPVTVGLRITDDKLIEVTIAPRGREPVVRNLTWGEGIQDENWEESLERAILTGRNFVTEYEAYVPAEDIARLRQCLDRADQALEAGNRREGRVLGRRISKEILFTESMGSLLFQAERLERVMDLPEELAARLGELCAVAKDLYRKQKREESTEGARLLEAVRQQLELGINASLKVLHQFRVRDSAQVVVINRDPRSP